MTQEKRNNKWLKFGIPAYLITAGAVMIANPTCDEIKGRLPGKPVYKLEEKVEVEKVKLEDIKPKKNESGVLPPTGCKEYVDILLDLNQKIGDERETLTRVDLPHLLASSEIGDTRVNQYLRFKRHGENKSLDVKTQTVKYDGKNSVLFVAVGDPIVDYELEFETGLESAVDADGNLTDLIGQHINILGNKYRIDRAVDKGSTFFNEMDLTLAADDFNLEWTPKFTHYTMLVDGTFQEQNDDVRHNGAIVRHASLGIRGQRLKETGRFEIQNIKYRLYPDNNLSVHRGESLRQKLNKDSLPGLKLDITYAGQTENGKHVVRVYERE